MGHKIRKRILIIAVFELVSILTSRVTAYLLKDTRKVIIIGKTGDTGNLRNAFFRIGKHLLCCADFLLPDILCKTTAKIFGRQTVKSGSPNLKIPTNVLSSNIFI